MGNGTGSWRRSVNRAVDLLTVQVWPSKWSKAIPRQRSDGRASAGPVPPTHSFRCTRMTTEVSASISPNAPSSTFSVKPATMRPAWVRSGSAACPIRGMNRKSSVVTTSVAAEASSDSVSRSRPRMAEEGRGADAATLSASPSKWRDIRSHVPATTNTTKSARNTALVVTGETATSAKKARNAMSRASRSVRRV